MFVILDTLRNSCATGVATLRTSYVGLTLVDLLYITINTKKQVKQHYKLEKKLTSRISSARV